MNILFSDELTMMNASVDIDVEVDRYNEPVGQNQNSDPPTMNYVIPLLLPKQTPRIPSFGSEDVR
jgi:hypothetical protein